MNPQELCLVLKGVPLAKESTQTVGLFASTYDKHKLNCLTDHLCKHLLSEGNEKNEYHSMWTADRRKKHKDLQYFADISLDEEQPIQKYIDCLAELGKSSPASLIITGFEMFLKFLKPKNLLKLMEAIQGFQAKNLSRNPSNSRISLLHNVQRSVRH